MNASTVEVIDRGLRCLSNHLGPKETELFISTILRERFDYTQWRQSFVDSIQTFDDLDKFMITTKEKARFGGDAEVL